MVDPELSEEVCQLIWSSVPTVDALELLIFLAEHPGQAWTAETLLDETRRMKEAELRPYLVQLQEQRLVVADGSGLVWKPETPALEAAVVALCRAYRERPVTLIRTVYSIADKRRIQAFADAFKLKKEKDS